MPRILIPIRIGVMSMRLAYDQVRQEVLDFVHVPHISLSNFATR